MVTAHYFGKGKRRILVLGENGKIHGTREEIPVANKTQAKVVAKERKALPWNF